MICNKLFRLNEVLYAEKKPGSTQPVSSDDDGVQYKKVRTTKLDFAGPDRSYFNVL